MGKHGKLMEKYMRARGIRRRMELNKLKSPYDCPWCKGSMLMYVKKRIVSVKKVKGIERLVISDTKLRGAETSVAVAVVGCAKCKTKVIMPWDGRREEIDYYYCVVNKKLHGKTPVFLFRGMLEDNREVLDEVVTLGEINVLSNEPNTVGCI